MTENYEMSKTLARSKPRRASADLPVPLRMAHVVLYTARYAEMKRWYQTVFNATLVLERDGKQAFMTFDDEHHRILVSHKPNFADRRMDAAGVAHVAWTYGTLADLFTTYDRLKAEGITPSRVVNHGMTTSLYYPDPDGNLNELQVENYDDVDEAFDLVAENRLQNVPFDADKMSVAVRAGVPEATLRARSNVIRMVEAGEL